ncbi:MAG: Maf family protein [Holosporales bacterium]|jgi:septum formation protein
MGFMAPLPWQAPTPTLILASGSQTRRELCERIGLTVQVYPADVDEDALRRANPSLSAGSMAEMLACAKAEAISWLFPNALVIGADQTLETSDGRMFNKASSRDDAAQQLRTLSNAVHRLHGGIALAQGGQTLWRYTSVARMTVRPLSEAFIRQYLDMLGGDALRSVGCYQYEGLGMHLFSAVEGEYSAILGLPLPALLERLRGLGVLAG